MANLAVQKKWGFGFGTLFSLIVVYFIYLYSADKGWTILAFVSKWYLYIVGGLFVLSIGIVLLVVLFTLLMVLLTFFKIRSSKGKARKRQGVIDADYEIRE